MQQRAWCLLFASLILLTEASSLKKKAVNFVETNEISPKGVTEISSPVQVEERMAVEPALSESIDEQSTVRDAVFASALEVADPEEYEHVSAKTGSGMASASVDSVDLNAHLEKCFSSMRLDRDGHVDQIPLFTVESVDRKEPSLIERLRAQNRLLDSESDKTYELIEANEANEAVEAVEAVEDSKLYDAITSYEAFLSTSKSDQLIDALTLAQSMAFKEPCQMTEFELIFSLARLLRRFLPNHQYPDPRVFLQPAELKALLTSMTIEQFADRLNIAEICLCLGWEDIARATIAAQVSSNAVDSEKDLRALIGFQYPAPAFQHAPTQLAWISAALGFRKVHEMVAKENQIEEAEFIASLLA